MINLFSLQWAYFQTVFSHVFYLEMKMDTICKNVEHIVYTALKPGGIPLQSVQESNHSFHWREVSSLDLLVCLLWISDSYTFSPVVV